MDNYDPLIEFYKSCAQDDARIWLNTFNEIPEDFSPEEVNIASDRYFEKSFGRNGEYVDASMSPQDGFTKNRVKALYKFAFMQTIPEVRNEINNRRKKDLEERKSQLISMGTEGKAAAARWYSSIENASFASTINEEDIERVSNIMWNMYHPDLMDSTLKKAFITGFEKDARILFSRISKEL